MKDGAASDTFGDTQSPVIRTEEQLSTQLASEGFDPRAACASVLEATLLGQSAGLACIGLPMPGSAVVHWAIAGCLVVSSRLGLMPERRQNGATHGAKSSHLEPGPARSARIPGLWP